MLVALLLAGCNPPGTPAPATTPAPEKPADIDMLAFGRFEYKERMELPPEVTRWNGRLVRCTGYMNPGWTMRGLKKFEMVMDRNSCCFGSTPRINHFFAVTLKPDLTMDHTNEPVTLTGRLVVEDRWDGDWQVGLYFLEDAAVVQ